MMGKRKLVEGGGVSQRGRGLGRCGIRKNWCLDSSSHVEDKRDPDHTTIYPPDHLGLLPSALVTKRDAHTLTACLHT